MPFNLGDSILEQNIYSFHLFTPQADTTMKVNSFITSTYIHTGNQKETVAQIIVDVMISQLTVRLIVDKDLHFF